MTKRRRANARNRQDAIGEELLPPPETPTRSIATDDELERRMRSALNDVYDVLRYASDERDTARWSKLELVNDLIH